MQGIAEFVEKGGFFMYLNILTSVVVLATIVERVVFILTKYRVNSREFLAQIRKLVQAGNIDRAIKLCEAAPLPLLQIVKAGLTQANRGEEAVVAAIEERMLDVAPELQKRIAALWSLANIATLLGLLGTITGLIRAFEAVSFASPERRSALLSLGISEAMNNTALGLGIAVTCMIAHLFLSGASKRIAADLERTAVKLENLLTLKNKVAG
ncbi:MAG: MotA/TolQ/ExbB proton channel family protein [Deltaproteobacteria bacterium]|nr:MotA/TolQ/ExbB proton channel family protein [Deltaproteobacteria bacterium]